VSKFNTGSLPLRGNPAGNYRQDCRKAANLPVIT